MKAEAHIKKHIKALTPQMVVVARYTLNDKDLVDNVVQDTIVALWEKCYAQKKLYKIEGYLWGIFFNKLAVARKEKLKRERLIVPIMDKDGKLNYDIADSICLDDYDNFADEEAVMKSLESLTEKQRKIVMMYCVSEMSMPKIAKAMGMSESGVRKILHKAWDKMRKYVIEERKRHE
ncbi:MAG: sigma-70 family RNA polymerase sigma factor [Bacteroidales bacterium]|nr:sigma-70 family RNA polymerase sigma factor [Bacteroidales bacterium]